MEREDGRHAYLQDPGYFMRSAFSFNAMTILSYAHTSTNQKPIPNTGKPMHVLKPHPITVKAKISYTNTPIHIHSLPHLKILIKSKIPPIHMFLLLLPPLLLLRTSHDTSLLVITHSLLEEVGLARQRDVLHEVEWVGSFVILLVAKSKKQTISHELDVLVHELGVHAEQSTGQSFSQELLLDGHGLGDDVLDGLFARAVVQVGEEEAGEIGVDAFVTGDELVGEGETRHETTLLEPEDGGEGAREEDTFDSSEGNETLSEGGVLVGDPSEGPVGLLADAGNCGTR